MANERKQKRHRRSKVTIISHATKSNTTASENILKIRFMLTRSKPQRLNPDWEAYAPEKTNRAAATTTEAQKAPMPGYD